jgi:D-tagatose-1,6-bisphosphate aldolase subunit GatZ/KbaZ
MKALREIISRHKAAQAVGICSACSAHPLVIEAVLRYAKKHDSVALIEATSNQVNQDGGYTGMRPADFRRFVTAIAARTDFDADRLLLGGDHLGPHVWQHLPAEQAMEKAERLIADYVAAGFRKIHLDCSMSCADDPHPLSDAVIAARAARLCAISERTWKQVGGEAPLYIVGTEVPVPGGAHETLETLEPTRPSSVLATIDAHQQAFDAAGLSEVWPRVIGLVVQPGVEFDHHHVVDFEPARASELARLIEQQPHMVYEAHSTDYQTQQNLRALVQRHFAILKVGPGLTFALREALWALDQIEREWLGTSDASQLRATVCAAMSADPTFWKKYYTSTGHQLELDWQYSLSDRIRYYWPVPAVGHALDRLFANLEAKPPPLTLLSQYMPAQYEAVRAGEITRSARELVLHHVNRVPQQYFEACGTHAS